MSWRLEPREDILPTHYLPVFPETGCKHCANGERRKRPSFLQFVAGSCRVRTALGTQNPVSARLWGFESPFRHLEKTGKRERPCETAATTPPRTTRHRPASSWATTKSLSRGSPILRDSLVETTKGGR